MWKPASMAGAVVLGLAGWPGAGQASGDMSCAPRWKLAEAALSPCASRAVLGPGNDTRVNLFFLLQDRQAAMPMRGGAAGPAPGGPFFGWSDVRDAFYPAAADVQSAEHYGSRCVSVALSSPAFVAALRANRGLTAADRAVLEQARGRLAQRCAGAKPAAWPDTLNSAPARAFLAYLQAADAFYAEDWDMARRGFDALRAARDPWVAETAAYMIARVDLNAAQAASFDQYGDFSGADAVDKAALARAQSGFDAYLAAYPRGRYAASAQGLGRRTLWLAGDFAGLARVYERQLAATPPGDARAYDLVQEIDAKLLMAEGARQAINGPLMLATLDLLAMRDADTTGNATISAERLAAQQSRFASHPELFGYLTAAQAYYVGKDMRRVLALIPDQGRQPSYAPLAFSRQVLRGMALAALRDRNEAGFWRDLLGGAEPRFQRPIVELALAMAYERSGRIDQVFVAGSPIEDATIRAILLRYGAGADILRAVAGNAARPRRERDIALFTLLTKQLGHGDYGGYLGDLALVPAVASKDGYLAIYEASGEVPLGLFRSGMWGGADYRCPALVDSARRLSRDPNDAAAGLCLGEFYRLNGFDAMASDDAAPQPDELGGAPSRFAGKARTRGDIYAAVIANPRAAANDKAYALYRAIQCYAPSGHTACGGAEVPVSQRRAWFQRLKKDYPDSQFAARLKYYW